VLGPIESNMNRLQCEVMDKQWEAAMLNYRKRDVICIGRDGNDELIKAPFSVECYVNLAREIIHRFRPEDEMLPGCSGSECDPELEMMTDFNLYSLSLLCAGDNWDNPEAVSSHGILRNLLGLTSPSSWLLSGSLVNLF
jgi:hypothetical protein